MATESQTSDNDFTSTDVRATQETRRSEVKPAWLAAALVAGVAGVALGLALGFASRIDAPDHDELTPVSIASRSKAQAGREGSHPSDRHAATPTREKATPQKRQRRQTPDSHGHSASASSRRRAAAAEQGPIESYATAARAAATAFAEGRYRVARAIYVAALESEDIPSSVEAEMRAGLAACYSRLGRKREAIEQAARAADLLLAEGSGKTLIELGDRLLEKGNDVGARRRYARVLLTADRPWADPGVEALAELRMAVAWQRAAERIARQEKRR